MHHNYKQAPLHKLKTYLVDFLHLIFPHLCAGCGRSLHTNEGVICVFCLHAMAETDFHNDPANPVAKSFYGRVPIQQAAAFYSFVKGGIVQALIHALKYKGKTAVGMQLGKLYGSQLKDHPIYSQVDLIIPIPLHPKKLQKRGYNQAEFFATGIASILNKPIITTAITRNKNTRTQTKLKRLDRWNNVNDIFQITDHELLKHKHILLVDDVVTTGATLDACATELIKTIPNVKISIAAIAYAEL